MSRGDSLKESSSSLLQSSHQPGYRSEPSLDGREGGGGAEQSGPERTAGGPGAPPGSGITGYSLGGHSYPSFSDSTVLPGGASRSSSARSSHNALPSEASSYKSLANQMPPPTPRNGSLSYNSLLTPSESQDFESAAPEMSQGRPCTPVVGYSSPFLSAQIAQQREAELHQPSASSAALLASQQHAGYLRGSTSSHHAPPERERERLLLDSQHHHHHHHHHHRPPRFSRPPLLSDSGPPQPSYPYRTRSTDTAQPPTTHPPRSPHPPPLGKSLSYSSAAAAEMQYRLVRKASASVGGGGIQAPKWVPPPQPYDALRSLLPPSSYSSSSSSQTPVSVSLSLLSSFCLFPSV